MAWYSRARSSFKASIKLSRVRFAWCALADTFSGISFSVPDCWIQFGVGRMRRQGDLFDSARMLKREFGLNGFKLGAVDASAADCRAYSALCFLCCSVAANVPHGLRWRWVAGCSRAGTTDAIHAKLHGRSIGLLRSAGRVRDGCEDANDHGAERHHLWTGLSGEGRGESRRC